MGRLSGLKWEERGSQEDQDGQERDSFDRSVLKVRDVERPGWRREGSRPLK